MSAGEEVLALRHVVKGYGEGAQRLTILRDVALSVRRGELVALVGPSGCGKSTLLQIAGLLALPDAGTVQVLGSDVSTANDDTRTALRRHHIGFVYQFHHLLPELSALENVMMPLLLQRVPNKEAAARAEALFQRVGLGARVAHRPAELSGGECQRVAIARALVANPSLVLADEPTGNLDPNTSEEVFAVMRDVLAESGAGALIVTHNPALAAGMHRTVTLAAGQVL